MSQQSNQRSNQQQRGTNQQRVTSQQNRQNQNPGRVKVGAVNAIDLRSKHEHQTPNSKRRGPFGKGQSKETGR